MRGSKVGNREEVGNRESKGDRGVYRISMERTVGQEIWIGGTKQDSM